MLRFPRRLGVWGIGLVEGRVGVGGDFMVSCFWVGGLGVFGVHNRDSLCFFDVLVRDCNLGKEMDVQFNRFLPLLLYGI